MSIRRRFALNARALLVVKLLLVMAVLFVAFAPTPAEADRCGTEIYYWDSTFTDNVGLRAWLPIDCGCTFYGWGSITLYRTFEDSVC